MRYTKSCVILLGAGLLASCSLFKSEVPLVVTPEIKMPEQQPIRALVNHLIFFKFDSSIAPKNTTSILEPYFKYLIQNPHAKLLIEGAADDTGTSEYNYKLGKKRANAIRDFFIQEGIAEEQLIVRSIGLLRPLNNGKSKKSLARNRRVTLIY